MNIEKVELWLNQCYSCHSKEFQPLYNWYLSLGLPLTHFESIRVPLKPEWQDFAKKMAEHHISLPFVVVRTEGNPEGYVFEYKEFIKNIERSKQVNLTKAQFDALKRQILVKEQKEEKEEAVKVVSMKKKQSRKKNTAVKKGKTVSTALD